MKNVIIIGGGVSGLSAGIYAQLNGLHATVCASHSAPGGCLTAWRRGDYHIDNCIHWLTGTNPNSDLYPLWKDLGVLGGVDIVRRPSLYTCELEGETLSLDRDLGRLKARMLELSPADEREIRSFIKAVKAMEGVRREKKAGDRSPDPKTSSAAVSNISPPAQNG